MLGFKHVRVLTIPGLSTCQGSEFPALHRVTYFHKFERVLNKRRNAIMEGF